MDVHQARTFLEIARSGSFVAAADSLHITQTAVSARIRTLEGLLGRRLFIRNKAGARLTPAGERLLRHARVMVQAWERARQQVALPPGRREGVIIGGELSLWRPLLADWLVLMHRQHPDIALRAEVDSPSSLLARVQDGALDLAVLYHPPTWPNLVSELLQEEKLVLVTTDPGGAFLPDQYVQVDWGAAFAANFQAAFPETGAPPVSISLGPLALTYLLTVGGCGYFRLGAAQPFLDEGRLRRVSNAPEFSHSAFAVYPGRSDTDVLQLALQGLRQTASTGAAPTI